MIIVIIFDRYKYFRIFKFILNVILVTLLIFIRFKILLLLSESINTLAGT